MIKVKTIETVALEIALTASVPIAIYEFIVDTTCYSIALTVLISFVSIFFFSRYFFKRFVVYKMTPIYRLVASRNISIGEIEKKISSSGNIMDKIREELTDWSEKRTSEIAALQERERFQREFVGDVAHEIKTPLFTLQGYIYTLLDGALEAPEINRLYLERASKSLERLIDTITELDEITKMAAGDEKLNLQVFDARALTQDVFAELELQAKKNNIKLKLASSTPQKVMVYADRGRIEQVLVNLITNSIKYGKAGGGTTIVNFIDMYEEVIVEVEDNGIGISQENHKRLFERFYRVDKSRSRDSGGTGLGLAIVRQIIEAHKGQLSLRSEPGKGSVFSFTLKKPLKK